MTGRRLLSMVAATALGLGIVAGGVASAKNACKKDCVQVKKNCLIAAKADKTACKAAGTDKATCNAAYKAAKMACIDAFVTGKTACKSDRENVDICSPSGAFVN